jgi:hypothetical protein
VAAGPSKVAAAILFSAPPAPAPVFRWRTLESAVPLQGPPASAAAAMLEAAAVVTEDDCGTGKKPVIFFCPRPFSSPPFFLLSDSLPMLSSIGSTVTQPYFSLKKYYYLKILSEYGTIRYISCRYHFRDITFILHK